MKKLLSLIISLGLFVWLFNSDNFVHNNIYAAGAPSQETKNVVNVILPPACNYAGRILTIKKINDNKHSLRSRPVKVRVQEGSIDFTDEIELKMNYSSRTIQSDGDNWWVVGHKGT